MGSRQARDRHTEWRARNVVIANDVTPLYRVRIAAMLAANAHFEFGTCRAAIFFVQPPQSALAIPVRRLERIVGENALFHIVHQQVAFRIVA